MIKNLTYNNFMRIMRIMQEEKHYSPEDAENITRQVFENVEADKGRLNRSAEYFAGLMVSAEEFAEMANNAFIEDLEQ